MSAPTPWDVVVVAGGWGGGRGVAVSDAVWVAVSGTADTGGRTGAATGTRWRMKTFHRIASAISVMDAAIRAVSRRSSIRAICQNARLRR